MAREMSFVFDGIPFSATPVKVDRSKLYGTTERLALDEDGLPCQIVYMDESGTIIIPKGGTAQVMLAPDGKCVDRSDLKTVRLDGSPAEKTPSSYGTMNELTRKVTAEELLDSTIKTFYQLQGVSPEIIADIGSDIYAFDYCYHESYETSPAFLLVSEQELFMLTGTHNDFSFVGLDEYSVVTDGDDDEDDDGEIDLDNLF
jgi:hypothetical protein